MNREHSVIFEIAPKHWFWTLLLTMFSSVQFSHSVVSDSLWPHEPQHARPPCPSPTPGVHPNPCPLSWWCHPTISSCCPLLHLPSIFPSSRVFPIGSYASLFFIASYLLPSLVTSIARHCFWLVRLFVLSGVISPLFSVGYWAPTNLGSSSFSVLSFCFFILFMGFSRQEYRNGLPLPSPMFIIKMFTIQKYPGNPWVFNDIKINNSVCLHHDEVASNENEWAKTTCSNVNESYKHNTEKELCSSLCTV